MLAESEYQQGLENTMPCLAMATFLVGNFVDCQQHTGNIISRRVLNQKLVAVRICPTEHQTVRLHLCAHGAQEAIGISALEKGQVVAS